MDLTVSATVSRPTGGALQLDNPGHYEIVAAGPGARRWRRRVVEGPYMHGRKSLGEVLESATSVLVVRVYGPTWSHVANRAQVMIDAFSQHAYTLTITLDGVVNQWSCEPADIALVGGDLWQKHHAMASMQEYQINVPRHPIPLQGAM